MDAGIADAAVIAWKLERRPDNWITRVFDYKPFLIFLCLLPGIGLLLVFLTYPLGLGFWLSLTNSTI
ncbi:MAG: sugar ABC transporter permease, partial [Acetobacteraceae bacterium]